MISTIKKDIIQNVGDNVFITAEFRGLSTDSKPIENIGNGSLFIEIDTGKIYFYDLEHAMWREFGGEAEPIVSNNEEEPQGNE